MDCFDGPWKGEGGKGGAGPAGNVSEAKEASSCCWTEVGMEGLQSSVYVLELVTHSCMVEKSGSGGGGIN
jgi:hypothetical protein